MQSIIKPLRSIGFLTIALTLALAANFAYGQWANPTAAPTGGNVAPPVNTSATTQTKAGNFGAATMLAADHMRSPAYCDENGVGPDNAPFTGDDNCFAAADGGAGGGGGAGWTRDRLIVPSFTVGRTNYTGPVDVSGYDFIEVGVFHSGGGSEWYSNGRAAQTTLIPVIPNTRAAINASSEAEDAIEHVRIDGNLRISFESWGDGAGSFNRLAFVNGLTFR